MLNYLKICEVYKVIALGTLCKTIASTNLFLQITVVVILLLSSAMFITILA